VAIVLFFDLYIILKVLRRIRKFSDPETPLLVTQGWVNEQEVVLLHNIAQSRLGWEDFQKIGINESCIWLQLHGKNLFVILPRHFFADDAQWQEAARIARPHILPK